MTRGIRVFALAGLVAGAAFADVAPPAAGPAPKVSVEKRFGEIWQALSEYAAAHDGKFPPTLNETGHPELRRGFDPQRSLSYTVAEQDLTDCKSPLPPKLIIVEMGGSAPGAAKAPGAMIGLFGDGQVRYLDRAAWAVAKRESAEAEWDAKMWLADDASTPKGAMVGSIVALALGDAEALKSRVYNVDPKLLEAAAETRAAGRELIDAAVKRFGGAAAGSELRPAKTKRELTRQALETLRHRTLKIEGDNAALGEQKPLEFKRTDGRWRMNFAPLFDNPTDVEAQLAFLVFRVNTRAARALAQEVGQGKYADLDAAKAALLKRTTEMARADTEFQRTAKANPGVKLPHFAMVSPWDLQQPAATGAKTGPGEAAGTAAPKAGAAPRPVNGKKPAETRKTEEAGGRGGGPFEQSGASGGPLVGVRYTMGQWGRQSVLRRLTPIYQAEPDNAALPANDKSKTLLARPGYVVGGLVVNYDDVNVLGVKVIFVRRTDGRIDPKDQYTSDWVGVHGGKQERKVDANGDDVIGFYGRQGLNLSSIGLLLAKDAAGGKARDGDGK